MVELCRDNKNGVVNMPIPKKRIVKRKCKNKCSLRNDYVCCFDCEERTWCKDACSTRDDCEVVKDENKRSKS